MTALVLSLLPSNHSVLMRGDVGQSVASAESRAMWSMNFVVVTGISRDFNMTDVQG